jgi:micrococcal nuclease
MGWKSIALILIALLLCGCVQSQETGFEEIETAVVERVIDGDTILLENGERVRLIGIDAPEKGEKCFEEAKNRLQHLVFGRVVFLRKDVSERDKYGRLVRYVFADRVFVNLALVEEGLALAFEFEPDNGFAHAFKSAELRAFDGNGCLWAD